MKTKFITRVLTAMTACALAAACARQGNPATPAPATQTATPRMAPTTAPTEAATPTVEAKPLAELPAAIETGTVVEFWHPWSGETANLLAELSDQFNQENEWEIEVVNLPRGDERSLIQDVEDARVSGELPDASALPADYMMSLQRQGVPLQDLDAYIQSGQWGWPEERVASFFPVFWGAAAAEGSRIGLPAYWSGHFLFYNQTWAGELGFTEHPAIAAEFEAQACAAALNNLYDGNPDTNGTGGYVFSQEAPAVFSWMRAFGGGRPVGENSGWLLAQTGDVAAGEFLYDLYLKDCSWTGRQALPYNYFSNRLALFYSGRLEEVLVQKQVNELYDSPDQWALIPYPSAGAKPVIFIEGSAYAILTADPQRALAAWQWIQWLLEPANQARLVEASGSFPLSVAALDELEGFRLEYPAWSQALQYLALADTVPLSAEWQMTKDVLSDFAWQLIRFTTSREDIPRLLQSAEELFRE